MMPVSENARIFLYGDPVDLRNGFDGLSYLAQTAFKDDMLPDTYFVFINPRRTRMKLLHLTVDDLTIWYVHLRQGVYYPPGKLTNAKINTHDLKMIMKRQTPKHLLCLQDTTKM